MSRRATPKVNLLALVPVVWTLSKKFPPRVRAGVLALALLGVGLYLFVRHAPAPAVAPDADPTTGLNPDGSGTFLFCFWNVENLFDDKDDRRREVDEPYDNAFSGDATLRQEKLDHLADALLKMNGGKGPDILACVEVESVRAADLLRGTLNRKLTEAKADPKLQYTQVSMKNVDGGRHIAPCVITRLSVVHALTKQHGSLVRILETHLSVNGHDLTLISSHWTSQLRQRDGSSGDSGRDNYAGQIRRVFDQTVNRNPDADFLLCGDFNATPDSKEVRDSLGTRGAPGHWVDANRRPLFMDLMSDKSPDRYGTIFYNGRPLIYDHVCVSAGMLDGKGWACDPASVQTVTTGLTRVGATRREPWRFGDPNRPPIGGRGYSDHFPVTVTLTVKPPANGLPVAPVAP